MQPSFNLSNSATFTEVLPGIFSGPGSSSEQRRRPSQSGGKTTSVRSAQLLHEKVFINQSLVVSLKFLFVSACTLFGYSGSTLGVPCV